MTNTEKLLKELKGYNPFQLLKNILQGVDISEKKRDDLEELINDATLRYYNKAVVETSVTLSPEMSDDLSHDIINQYYPHLK